MCRIRGYIKGNKHLGWSGFKTKREPLIISLKNLSEVDRIISPKGIVFVFENPSVFSTILDRIKLKELALVCTGGQLKLASLILLDHLANEDNLIYYAGDFDPEGLGIADKLKKRYGSNLHLWHYELEDYYLSLSRKKIDKRRLSNLNNLQAKKLKEIGECIKKEGYAAYQELLIEDYLKDILDKLKCII